MQTILDSLSAEQIERSIKSTPQTFLPYRQMVGIVKAAAGRPLTEPQQRDFDAAHKALHVEATKSAHGTVAGLKAINEASGDPEAAIKAAEAFMSRSDRIVYPENTPVRSMGTAPTGTKASAWSDAVEEYAHANGMKALVTSGSVAVTVPLSPEPITLPQRARFVSELIPAVEAEGGSYAYLRQSVRTNNAAPVAAGGTKPTSIYTLVRVDDTTRVIAHLSERIPRFYVEDAPLLRSFIQSEMFAGIRLALDAQLLSGNGAGANLTGITATTGIGVVTTGVDALVRTRTALTSIQQADVAPDAYVFTPSDWAKVEAVAMSQFAANAAAGNPVDGMTRTLWGVPVMVSTSLTNGTALLGDFKGSSSLFYTGQPRLDWSENSYDSVAGVSDFERNYLRFRAEGRFGFAVTRPTGFVSITIA
ncbi:MAG: phage major capsid protein [Chloroflexota bacterium]|nr:phage major capsid protein [Chloroflexota bacterium]